MSSRSGVQTRWTVISFSVSVPVLSVQITVVSPSVSTEDRRRTSALRFAIRCVASASDSVTVGSSPSGTSATMTPIANTNRSSSAIPPQPGDDEEDAADRDREHRHEPRHAVDLALERAALALGALRERGDAAEPGRHAGGRDERLARVPAVTYVPAKTCRSAATGVDSPVSADSSTRRSVAVSEVGVRGDAVARREQRARRPGRRRRSATSAGSPSRRTRTRRGSICCSAATARSARCSWKNEKTRVDDDDDDDRDR